jgi:hypothetical protein
MISVVVRIHPLGLVSCGHYDIKRYSKMKHLASARHIRFFKKYYRTSHSSRIMFFYEYDDDDDLDEGRNRYYRRGSSDFGDSSMEDEDEAPVSELLILSKDKNPEVWEIWTEHILPFVGRDQFAFVGFVNRGFCRAYLSIFPAITTFEHILTMPQAKMCYRSIRRDEFGSQEDAFRHMAGRGRLDILEFWHSKGIQWDFRAPQEAAIAGYLPILQWLYQHACYRQKNHSWWDRHVASAAASHSDLTMLKWLYKQYCKFDARTCSSAGIMVI